MRSQTSPPRGLPVWLILPASLGTLIGFHWTEGDYIMVAALTVMLVSGLWGYCLGAVRLIGVLGAFFAAYQFTPAVARWVTPWLAQHLHASPWSAKLLSFGAAALTIVVLVTLTAAVMSRWVTHHRPYLKSGNQLLGFGVGAAEGALVILVFLSGSVTAAPLASQRLNMPEHPLPDRFSRVVAEQVVDIAKQTESSTIGPLVAEYNPFDTVPQLKSVRRTIDVLRNPQMMTNLVDHPAMVRLQDKPSVRAAMESLAGDPQLRELATSGKPIDGVMALSLLKNPNIMKLLESPELIRDITQALGEINESKIP